MKVAKYSGDSRLRYRVDYSRNSYSECIYCGEKANTREHIPSKVFLKQPLPANLSIVPACSICNISYSDDELFLALLIEKLKQKNFGPTYRLSPEVLSRMEKNKKLVSDIHNAIEKNDLSAFHSKILRVLTKLAIGHSVYELSEGYFTHDEGVTADAAVINFSFANNMSDEEIAEFEWYFVITDLMLPEIGSRIFERLLSYQRDDGKEEILVNWIEVQASEYKYTCYLFGSDVIVKIVINDFLFAEVTLKPNFF